MCSKTVSTMPFRLAFIVLVAAAASATQADEGDSPITPRVKTNPTLATKADWQPVTSGRLDNGVRFAILPRQGDEPGVGLLMRNEGGFIAERRPGERGLTHLIEHLLFDSPTLRAPNDRHHLQTIGLPLTLPAATAGTTSWRESNFFVSTRTTRPADLDVLLGLFREVATDLTFRADAVDEQRADVVREMAGRKLGNDIYASYIAAIAPGSPTDVIDAQNSDDVPRASIATIRDLYRRLYQPENMMIVIVGNVDPVDMKALIRKHFGDWKHVGPPTMPVPVPRFQSDRIAPISVSAMSQGRRTALMTVVTPAPPPPATRWRQIDAMLMERLAIRAVDNRLTIAQPDAPRGKTGVYIENGEQGHRLVMLWDNFADAWQPAIVGLSRTACALRTVGFSAAEWDIARRDVIQDLAQRTVDMGKAPNVELAKDLSHALADGRALISPSELLQRAQLLLPTINTDAGNQWWRQQWGAGVEHIRVESPALTQVADPTAAIRRSVDGATAGTGCVVRE